MDAYKPQVLKELFVDTSSKTLEEFQEWLLVQRKKNGEKYVDSTIERYVTFIKRYSNIFISKKLTTTQLNDLVHLINNSIIYSTIMLWLQFHGFKRKNDKMLFAMIDVPAKSANASTSERFLRSKVRSREELKQLVEQESDPLYKELYLFSYDTACRRAEIFSAKWKNAYVFNPKNTNEKHEFIDKGIAAQIRVLGKGRKWRVVYVFKTTFDMMQRRIASLDMKQETKEAGDFPIYKLYQKDGKHLYKNPSHEYYKHLREHSLCVIGRETHPHCFRHTQATHMADRGCSPHKILAYIGDEDIKMAIRYVDISTFDSRAGFVEYSRALF